MNEWLLVIFVFAAAMAAVLAVASAIGGVAGRRLRSRLDSLADTNETAEAVSAIRARYLRQLTPLERSLEQLPGMERFRLLMDQAGWTAPAYRVAGLSLFLGTATAFVALLVASRTPWIAVLAWAFGASLPLLKARRDRAARLEKFEAQLPDALDLMTRSLLAGNPLMESFKFVSEEMKPPIAIDFGRAWSNVNYGVSLKASLADMIARTPSTSLRSLSTAILVQRETGGNLAEILEKITQVLRARAKFQRRLKTLTAEGRMSGWVLGGLPFALAGLLSVVQPGYLTILFNTPDGQRLMAYAGGLMVVGIFWISRLLKVRV